MQPKLETLGNMHLLLSTSTGLSRPAAGILIAVLIGVINAINSQVLRKQGDDPGKRTGFQLVAVWSRLFLALAFLIFLDFKIGSMWFLLFALISGFLYAGNNLGAYYAIMMGPVAIAWTIAWLSAPVVGFMWAIWPSNEPWTVNQFSGIGLFLVCLPLMGISTYTHNKSRHTARRIQNYFFIVALAALFFGSLAGYFNKLANSYAPVISGSPSAYLVLASLTTALGFSMFHAARKNKATYSRPAVVYGFLCGLLTALQIVLVAHGIRLVQVSRFFPTTACTAILLSTVFSIFLQKEVPSILTVLGIATCIGAIIFFALG